jgi:hypothetical protein
MNNRYAPGTTVLVPQHGRECAGIVVRTAFAVTIVRMIEGRNAGICLDVPTTMVRVPAAFEVVS